MKNRRLMIRLIDVALIILLGFIAISRLKTEYVSLPTAGKNIVRPRKYHPATLQIYRDYFILQDMGQKKKLRNLENLEDILVKANNHYFQNQTKMVVNIEPRKSSIMQSLIDVFDICQRNNIEKNLNYEANY